MGFGDGIQECHLTVYVQSRRISAWVCGIGIVDINSTADSDKQAALFRSQ